MGKGPFSEGWDDGIWEFEGGFGEIEVVFEFAEDIAIYKCELDRGGLGGSKPAVPAIPTDQPTCCVNGTILKAAIWCVGYK